MFDKIKALDARESNRKRNDRSETCGGARARLPRDINSNLNAGVAFRAIETRERERERDREEERRRNHVGDGTGRP